MTPRQIYERACARFVERAEENGYKGKRRDDLAMEFVLGVACAFAPDSAEQKYVLMQAAMLVSVRGFKAVAEAAAALKSPEWGR